MRPLVSFGAAVDEVDEDDDAMSTAASGSGDWSACKESEAFHREVREPPALIDEELVKILSEAVQDLVSLQSLVSALTSFKPGRVVILECFLRLLGRMAAAAVMFQLRLLHMRPLQMWLKSRVPRRAWKNGQLCVLVTRDDHEDANPLV